MAFTPATLVGVGKPGIFILRISRAHLTPCIIALTMELIAVVAELADALA